MKQLKSLLTFLISFTFHTCLIAQIPEPAFNPMTALGARGISVNGHILFWENPNNITHNEVYFSSDSLLVANSDPAARVLNGYPSTIFNQYSLSNLGTLEYNTKYFWKVVEYNGNYSSFTPVWYFKTTFQPIYYSYYEFDYGLQGWQSIGPQGITNWSHQNTSNACGVSGEVRFFTMPLFYGNSFLISPQDIPPLPIAGDFRFFLDHYDDTSRVGLAYTTNNGISWTSIWELTATSNVGPTIQSFYFQPPEECRLGFYYKGDSWNIDAFYFDNFSVGSPLTAVFPPKLLRTIASQDELKIQLNWDSPGNSGISLIGYRIIRKEGLPFSNSPYLLVNISSPSDTTYIDYNIELNKIYTYRINAVYEQYSSLYGNESSAYVPAVIPVELINFDYSLNNNNVILSWRTASELNNQGFEIQRKKSAGLISNEWHRIGFVNSRKNSTEINYYKFEDKNLNSGRYYYRLKQIDLDGSFNYSNEIELNIEIPKTFSLEQNYPNPFNPSTMISWQSPVSGWQTLKVYDILGNEVATLVDEYRDAGRYEVEFNAVETLRGVSLPSGVYFYQLRVPEPSSSSGKGFVETKKMILTK